MSKNVQWVKRQNGELFFSDSFKDKRCMTVVLSFEKAISKRDFLNRYFDLLPNDVDLYFFKNEIEFDVKTLNGHVPDKLIKDVTQEMKGGDDVGDKEDEVKELNAREALREHCLEEHEVDQYREVAAAARDLSNPQHKQVTCPVCSKIVNERGICECR